MRLFGAGGLLSRILAQRLVRFILVGGVNTVFGYSVFAIGVLLGVPSTWALAIAWTGGVIFNFFTTGRLVFDSRSKRRFPAFAAANVAIYFFNLGILKLLEAHGVPPLLGQVLCLPPTVLLSFLVLNTLVFRNSAPKP